MEICERVFAETIVKLNSIGQFVIFCSVSVEPPEPKTVCVRREKSSFFNIVRSTNWSVHGRLNLHVYYLAAGETVDLILARDIIVLPNSNAIHNIRALVHLPCDQNFFCYVVMRTILVFYLMRREM